MFSNQPAIPHAASELSHVHRVVVNVDSSDVHNNIHSQTKNCVQLWKQCKYPPTIKWIFKEMCTSILPVCIPVHSLKAGLVLEEVKRGHQKPLELES